MDQYLESYKVVGKTTKALKISFPYYYQKNEQSEKGIQSRYVTFIPKSTCKITPEGILVPTWWLEKTELQIAEERDFRLVQIGVA